VPAYCGSATQGANITVSLVGTGGPITSATLNGAAIPTTGGTFLRIPDSGQGSATYTAVFTGPGGSSSCSGTLNTYCNQTEFIEHGTYMIPLNNPPLCHWRAQDVKTGDAIADRGCNPGCFAPETDILLAGGRTKKAALIQAGDALWNPVQKRGLLVRKIIVGPEKLPLVEIGYGKTLVHVSSKHPMVTRGGIKRADGVTLRDSVLGVDGRFHKLTRVRRLPIKRGQIVYNFELAADTADNDEHMIVGDGVVTGDYFLQVELEKNLLN
jgi:hypothetical protein